MNSTWCRYIEALSNLEVKGNIVRIGGFISLTSRYNWDFHGGSCISHSYISFHNAELIHIAGKSHRRSAPSLQKSRGKLIVIQHQPQLLINPIIIIIFPRFNFSFSGNVIFPLLGPISNPGLGPFSHITAKTYPQITMKVFSQISVSNISKSLHNTADILSAKPTQVAVEEGVWSRSSTKPTPPSTDFICNCCGHVRQGQQSTVVTALVRRSDGPRKCFYCSEIEGHELHPRQIMTSPPTVMAMEGIA